MGKPCGTMTMTERVMLQRVIDGYLGIWTALEYIWHQPHCDLICKYLLDNGITGDKFAEILLSDFNGNLDNMIKWTLKSNPERTFKL